MKLLWADTLHCSSPAAASQPVSHGGSVARVAAVSDCHRCKSIGFVFAPKNASLVQRTLLWCKLDCKERFFGANLTAKNASLAQGQSLPSHPRLRLASRWCSLTRMPACFCTRFPFIPCWPLLVSQLFLANPPPSPPTHTKALPVRNVERPRGGELAAAFRVDFARGQAAFGRTKAFSFLGRWAAAAADPKEAVFRAYHPRAQHPAPPPAPPAAGPDLRTATGSRQAARTQPATSLGCARCQRHERNECTK